MSRKKLAADSLQNSLKAHLVPETETAFKTCSLFLDEYELPAGVVQNLKSARKHLQQAVALSKAAEVIADFQVED